MLSDSGEQTCKSTEIEWKENMVSQKLFIVQKSPQNKSWQM